MMELNLRQASVLALLESQLKTVHDSIHYLDAKLNQNMSVISIVTGLVGAINSSLTSNAIIQDEFLTIIFVIYIATIALSAFGLRSRVVATYPLKPTWEESQRVLLKSDEAYYDWLVASYITVIKRNTKALNFKAFLHDLSLLGILITITVLFVGIAV